MMIIVAFSNDVIKVGPYGGKYIETKEGKTKSIELSKQDKDILDGDNFMIEMWNNLDAMFDWGDFDYFEIDRCIKFHNWLNERIKRPITEELKHLYLKINDLVEIAIKNNTAISFDL